MTWSVDIWPSLQQIPERFEPLFADAGDSSLFAGKDWWALLEKHGFPDKQTTAYVAIERDNKPIMVCPLRHPALGEPGAWRSLSNYYSHSYAPLLAKGEAPEKLQRAFCELGKAVLSKGSPYPSLCLDPIWNQGNWAAPALRGLKAAGFATSWTEVDETWSINVIDMQPAQYYQQLPGKLRNTIERKTQQAEARVRLTSSLRWTAAMPWSWSRCSSRFTQPAGSRKNQIRHLFPNSLIYVLNAMRSGSAFYCWMMNP